MGNSDATPEVLSSSLRENAMADDKLLRLRSLFSEFGVPLAASGEADAYYNSLLLDGINTGDGNANGRLHVPSHEMRDLYDAYALLASNGPCIGVLGSKLHLFGVADPLIEVTPKASTLLAYHQEWGALLSEPPEGPFAPRSQPQERTASLRRAHCPRRGALGGVRTRRSVLPMPKRGREEHAMPEYIIMRKQHALDCPYALAQAGEFNSIFNALDPRVTSQGDGKRCQAACSDELRDRVHAAVLAAIGTAGVGDVHSYAPDHCVVLRSFAGCAEQYPHLDYDPDRLRLQNAGDALPIGALLALQDNTRFVVFPRGSGEPRRVLLELGAGDLLLFRGDLVHAGAAYEQCNVRIHCYVLREGHPLPKDQTWPVDPA